MCVLTVYDLCIALAGEDRFQSPQLLRGASCALEGLSLNLQPTVERFDEDLCTLLSEDRANRENRAQESLSISVVERRLQVSVAICASFCLLTSCCCCSIPLRETLGGYQVCNNHG